MVVRADIIFSEIMYALEGADTGREWVEIFNNGSNTITPTEWRLFENGTNHKLTLVQGGNTLSPGGYAVIADNTEKFLTDWPNFSGVLFDSSFSLSNTGETLVLRDAELIDRDTVSYTSEWGALDDGNSLQYSESAWSASAPTPGSGTLSITNGNSASVVEQAPETNTSTNFPVEPKIFAFVYGENEVTVGADAEFTGVGLGLMEEPLIGARYLWNFGDGARKEGEVVLHHYRYPGTYVVVLDVSSGKYSATNRIVVTAFPAQVRVVDAHTDAITLRNDDSRELNLSWWVLEVFGKQFSIPEHTILLPKKEVTLASDVTDLSPGTLSDVVVRYPNGEVVEPVRTQTSVSVTPKSTIVVARAPIVGSSVSPIEVPEVAVSSGSGDQQASVLTSFKEDGNSFPYKWVLLLSGLIILASGGVIVLRRMTAEEITIID